MTKKGEFLPMMPTEVPEDAPPEYVSPSVTVP